MHFCQKCGGPPIHGKRVCHDCLINVGDLRKRRQEHRLKAGLCIKCGKPREKLDRKNCEACREIYRLRTQKRLDSSLNPEDFIEPILDGQGNAEILPYDCEPTEATPGSEAKLQVLERRYQDGKALFHPEDERKYSRMASVAFDSGDEEDDDEW